MNRISPPSLDHGVTFRFFLRSDPSNVLQLLLHQYLHRHQGHRAQHHQLHPPTPGRSLLPDFIGANPTLKEATHSPPQDADSLYQSEQLLPIFQDMAVRLRGCKTRYDQIYTLGMLLIQYG